MIYSVKISKQAENDLRSIYEYIAFELQSLQNAQGQISRLESNILKLKEMPERFSVFEKEPWKSRNLRVMPVDNYLVFYIPDKLTKTVNIIRVMYGGRDTEKQLNQN
ncbi:MAG: type II toxin-antitoxin system RelE/ParE family toxin [Acutalibacteraceae bacterium]